MLNEHATLRKFWAEAISIACYISNRVFLRAKLHKTSYELRFGHSPNISHLRVFGCRCFILKHGNLDKFESRSSYGIFLGYAVHTRGYRVFSLETNKIAETCEATFDESSPGIRSGNAGIQVNDALEGIFYDSDDDERITPIHSTTHISTPMESTPSGSDPTSNEVEVTTTTPLSPTTPQAPLHIQRRHPPEQMIGELDKRVLRNRYNSEASYAHAAFV